MSINDNTVEVNLTPQFRKDLKDLAKRYRSIRKDLQPLIEELQSGNTPGDRIQGLNYQVFKVRLKKRCDPLKGSAVPSSRGTRIKTKGYSKRKKRGLSSDLLPSNPNWNSFSNHLFQIRFIRRKRSHYRASH